MEPPFTPRPIQFNQTETHHPRHGPPYGFYIGVAILAAIVTIGLVCCWRVNHNRRGGCRPRDQLNARKHGHPSIPPENVAEPQQAYILPSSETLPLYRPDYDFTKQLLKAWTDLESPGATRPPSYRSRLTLDLEAAVKTIDENDR